MHYIKRIDVMIGSQKDKATYGYLCLDLTTQSKEFKKVAAKSEDEDLPGDITYDKMQESGLFMIVATRPIAKEKILPFSYTRNQVEELFRIGSLFCA